MAESFELNQKNLQPDWENAPTISDLKQNLRDAEIDHNNHQADIDRWLDNMYVEGKARPTTIPGRSSVQPKLIRKQAEWRYSSLASPFLSTPDVFNVNPMTGGDRERAKQNALVLNHQFNTYIDKVAFIDAFVRDAVDLGTVIVEVSWVSEEEEINVEIPEYSYQEVFDPVVARQYMNLLQLKAQSRDLYEQFMNPGLDKCVQFFASTQRLYVATQTGTRVEKQMVETKNYPALEVCEPANILIDPSCGGDMDKAQFVIKRHKASLSDLKKDGRYSNLDKLNMEAQTDPLNDPDFKESQDIESFTFKDKARKQLVITTYWGNWDIHETGIAVPIVASWVGSVMIQLDENPFPFRKPPFAKAVYMPKRKSVYGEPDGELLEDNQKIVGAVTRGMIDLMAKSSNAQTATKQGSLDATNSRKMKNGEDFEYNGQGDPRHFIHQLTYPEIPQSAYNMIQMQNMEAESLTGVKAFASGINAGSLGESVGGGRDAMDAASKRESDILLRLAQGIKDIGRMVIAMNAVWLSEEEVIRITDDEFVTVRRDDLDGSFDLTLSISTAEEDNQKAQELAFMLQTIGNDMDLDLQKMLLSDIARLRKMPDLAMKIEAFEPKPDPLAIAKAQKEVELLDAQIAKERALEAKHNSEAIANGARGYKDETQGHLNESKAGTEVAKSRNLHSDSDNKDLDYMDKHSGAGHRRELEKLDKQASNALNSEIVKAELNKYNNKEAKK